VDIELPLKISLCKLRRHRKDRTVVWSRVQNLGDSPAYSKLSVASGGPFPRYFFISECRGGGGFPETFKSGVDLRPIGIATR
jgi:hypothetical protein